VQLTQHKTDGHMDSDEVRAGAIIVCPVKVQGAGVHLGDVHAGQGDGEIAGHTMDVAGSVTLQVEVVKNYPLDGPMLFPLAEDLPPMARPFTEAEKATGQRLAAKWGVAEMMQQRRRPEGRRRVDPRGMRSGAGAALHHPDGTLFCGVGLRRGDTRRAEFASCGLTGHDFKPGVDDLPRRHPCP
jgi:hypothetical protein